MTESRKQPRAKFAFAGEKPPPRHLSPKEAAKERRKKLCAKYEAFFAPIVEQLRTGGESGRLLKVMQGADCNDRGFESRFPPLCFNFGFWGPNGGDRHRPYVYLYIREPDRARAVQILELLQLRKDQLTATLRQIDPTFDLNQWSERTASPNSKANYCTVGMQIDGTINDPPERLDKISQWMLAFYPALKDAMEPHLEEIVHELG